MSEFTAAQSPTAPATPAGRADAWSDWGRSNWAWRNWAGNQEARPARVLAPASTDEVAAAITAAAHDGLRIKAAGAGHSFTAIGVTDGVLLQLNRLTGITRADRESGRVRVLGGTRLADLSPVLWELGLALPNLGDIDVQTLTGALATGTHGTGAGLTGLAGAVSGLRIVTADGTSRWCSESEHPRLFQAARVGLGALGVITEVELQCRPAYLLRAQERPGRLAEVLDRLPELVEGHRHVEFYWFPHTDRVLTKVNDPAPDAELAPLSRWREYLDDELLSNVVFERVNRIVAGRPALAPRVNQLSARALSAREYVDRSYRVFCTRRDVRFTESEYAVPRAALDDVLRELRGWIERSGEKLPFPVEVRFAAADDVWLSTAHERPSAYVAIHQYHRMDNRRYFAAFEAIVAEHNGRPHWGKLHTLDAQRLARLYPRLAAFQSVRAQVDPGGVFANPYLDRVLGSVGESGVRSGGGFEPGS